MFDDPSGYLSMPSVESPTASLYAQDDLRKDLLHRNTLSTAPPDSERWPGLYNFVLKTFCIYFN